MAVRPATFICLSPLHQSAIVQSLLVDVSLAPIIREPFVVTAFMRFLVVYATFDPMNRVTTGLCE